MTEMNTAAPRETTDLTGACDHCARLNQERHQAELRGDRSAAVDALVLLRRHWRAAHRTGG
ncbi:hypothetical protein FGW37_19260 [Streptomyces rectiverticillatus]|nr:hypothetical protein FGW37_19260 [Streptomyces rectiverticillatus]